MRQIRPAFVLIASLLPTATALAAPLVSELKSDEQIVFYPALATPATNGGWDVHVHGCVFEVEKRRVSLAVLRGVLRLDGIKMNHDEAATFKERARLFFADNERGHRVVACIGEQAFNLGESAANGHFEQNLHLAALPSPVTNQPFEIAAVLKDGDARRFTGVTFPAPATGVSVITDIDDTIKVSDVRDHDALVRRTFLLPFEAVPGMAELYRGWATNGAQFHYVSASPWQLHPPLAEFTRTNGFPAGSWHMKTWRLKDRTFRSLFEDPREYKIGTIAPLLWQFPQRRFVLVGDSGERDPEAYAALAREFPKQVAAIYIRDVTGESADSERYRTNFTGVPRDVWRVFEQPPQLPRGLPK